MMYKNPPLDPSRTSNYTGFDVDALYTSGDPVDEFLGLGNKQKKAAKKTRKAEKQLAKGHVKKAAKKAHKAEKLQGKVSRAQQDVINAKAGQAAIQDTAATIEANKASVATPGTSTTPGATAYDPISNAPTSAGGGGGGSAPDYGSTYADTSTDTPVEDQTPDSEMTQATDTVETEETDDDPITAFFKSLFGFDNATGDDTPTGAMAQTKTLGGVTVVAHKKKKSKMLVPVLVVVVLLVIFRKKLFK